MGTLAVSAQELASSWWHYVISLNRALERERAEVEDSFMIAADIAFNAAAKNPLSWSELFQVAQHSQSLFSRGIMADQEQLSKFLWDQVEDILKATNNTFLDSEGETLEQYIRRQGDVMSAVADFNVQIEKIKDEFGFHFNTPGYELIAETPSFLMYQVLPNKQGVTVRSDLKPMLLVPPYMLGVNILAFLPLENKSYAHAFANDGIPTYVRVVKDIWETEAVQTMTPEDDCSQTADLCRKLVERHGQKTTLNGTCQGGYICLKNLLSGTLTGVCDTLISNVTPVDGTHSKAISGMPQLHSNFVLSPMPNGNMVANGYLLSLGMRFVAIDRETPLITVLNLAKLQSATKGNPGKTPAALYRWLRKERVHLPPATADMSSISFQQPITEDGTLPVKLFGKPLNIRDLAGLGVKWYQNYATKDDLVTPPCATAGNRFLDATDVIETVALPGGHVAILTSPYSKSAPVNGVFTDAMGKSARGPVKFQLDMSKSAAGPA
ncbi:MAG: metal transporter [Rhodospirillales bacterium]|nr:metal transporter [Rhodospirillales bacterium]